MNPILSHARRECQTIRHCGVIYRRWRFAGQHYFARPNTERARTHRGRRATFAQTCLVCGSRLRWPANFEPAQIRAVRATERRDAYYDLRVNRLVAGLTSQGRPFQRTPNYLTEAGRLAARRRRGLVAWQKRAGRFAAAGLTTRGTPRKRAGLVAAWQQFRNETSVTLDPTNK